MTDAERALLHKGFKELLRQVKDPQPRAMTNAMELFERAVDGDETIWKSLASLAQDADEREEARRAKRGREGNEDA